MRCSRQRLNEESKDSGPSREIGDVFNREVNGCLTDVGSAGPAFVAVKHSSATEICPDT
jgi:hypothetical protein